MIIQIQTQNGIMTAIYAVKGLHGLSLCQQLRLAFITISFVVKLLTKKPSKVLFKSYSYDLIGQLTAP